MSNFLEDFFAQWFGDDPTVKPDLGMLENSSVGLGPSAAVAPLVPKVAATPTANVPAPPAWVTSTAEGALNALIWADNYLLSRPTSTILQATNLHNPLYRDGLSWDDFGSMWDASEYISPGRAAVTNLGDEINFFQGTTSPGDWNEFSYGTGYNPYTMSPADLENKWDSSVLGTIGSASFDIAFQVGVGGKGIDAAAGALRRAAGLSGAVRTTRDLAALRTAVDEHVTWVESAGTAGKRSPVWGQHIEDMANSRDFYEIYKNPMLDAATKTGSVRQRQVAELIQNVSDVRTVADLVLADKGDVFAIGRLIQAKPDYAWTLSGMDDALRSKFIVDGQWHPGADEAARIAKVFDSSIERDAWYQNMLDTFLIKEGDDAASVGDMSGKYVTTARNSTTVSMTGPAGHVQAWLAKRASELQIGESGKWLEHTIGVDGRHPVTTFMHWMGSRKPLNHISLSGVRPTEVVDEFLAYAGSSRVLRGNRNITVSSLSADGLRTTRTLPAAEWRREALGRLGDASSVSDIALRNEVEALESELMSAVVHQYNVEDDTVARVVKGLQDQRNRALEGVARDGQFWHDGRRMVLDPVTARQTVQDIYLMPLDEFDWALRKISEDPFAKQGLRTAKVIRTGSLAADAVYKWFRTLFLFKPGYVAKNSFAEPGIASLLAHGTVLSPDGVTATMGRFFINRARGMRQAAFAMKDRAPWRGALQRAAKDEARLADLHMTRMRLQQQLDEVMVYEAGLDSAGTSPAMREKNLRLAQDQRADLARQLGDLEAYLDDVDPTPWRQFQDVPSYRDLSDRVRDLETIVSGDLGKASELRAQVGRIQDRARQRSSSQAAALNRQIADARQKLADTEADTVLSDEARQRVITSILSKIDDLESKRLPYQPLPDGSTPLVLRESERAEIERLTRFGDAIERRARRESGLPVAGEPRITIRDSHYGEDRGWGSERLPFYIDEQGKRVPLNDVRIDRAELPDTLWHVTTNGPAVSRSGMLLASDGSRAGLGGTSHLGAVSFTTNRDMALLIRDDMRLYASLRDVNSLDEAIDLLLADFRNRSIFESEEESIRTALKRYQSSADSNLHGTLDSVAAEYFSWRRTLTSMEPPLIFGGLWKPDSPWWTIDPADINIVMVPKKNIPTDALVTDIGHARSGEHAEVRVWSDVPVGVRRVTSQGDVYESGRVVGQTSTRPPAAEEFDPRAALASLQTKLADLRNTMTEQGANQARSRGQIKAELDAVMEQVAGIQPRIAARQMRRENARRRDLGGERPFTMNIDGQFIFQEGVFSASKFGTALRAESSADRSALQSWNPASYMESKTTDWARSGDTVIVYPSEPRYYDELAYIANRQVRGDAFAIRVLRGDSDQELFRWSTETPRGRSYWQRMGMNHEDLLPRVVGTRPAKPLAGVGRTPGTTGPEITVYADSPLIKKAELLRYYFPDEALQRRLVAVDGEDITAGELRDALGARTDLAPIHAADLVYQGGGWGKVNRSVNNALGSIWRGLAATPESRFGRWPFVDRQFRMNLESDLRFLQGQGMEVTERTANALRQAAFTRALKEAENTFYNIRRYSNPVYAMRYLVGFPGAFFNSLYRYARLAYRNPGRSMVLANAWTSSYRSLGLDKDGKPTDDWRQVESIAIPVPKAIQDRFPVSDKWNLGLRGWEFVTTPPASTPLVTWPVSMMIKSRPGVDEWVKENLGEDTYRLLYPYGRPNTDSTVTVGALALDSFVPPYLLSLATAINKFDEDAVQTADMIYAYRWYEWEKNGFQGKAPDPEDAARESTMFWYLKAGIQFFSSGGNRVTPVGQFYRDEWRRITQAIPNDEEAQKKAFIDLYGIPAEVFTISTSKNRAGMPYTQDAYRVLQDNAELVKDLRQMNPDDPTATVMLLFGDRSGEFSQAVYDAVAGQSMPGETYPIRSKKTPFEMRDEFMKLRSWEKYTAAVGVRDALMEQYGIKVLLPTGKTASLYDSWNRWLIGFKSDPVNAQWRADFETSDSGLSYRVLTGLSAVVANDKFMQANGSQATYQIAVQYLDELERAKVLFSEQTTAESREYVAREWDSYVRQTYLAGSSVFSGWYVRYLDGGRDLANRRVFE